MENTIENKVEETKEVLKITMDNPVDFEPVGDIKITSTDELGKIINDVMVQAFADYCGCSLQCQFVPDRGYVVIPKLYFNVLKKEQYTDDKYFCFKTLESQPKSDIIGRVQRLSQISATNSVKVDITDDGKSVLEDFIITPNKNVKFEWNGAYNVLATATETYIEVYKLDMLKFVRLIFGDTDANGSALYYQITPTGVIGGNNPYKKADNWSLNIVRLNHANEAKAADLLGYGQITTGVGPAINRATTGK